jgi:hypothetical protein
LKNYKNIILINFLVLIVFLSGLQTEIFSASKKRTNATKSTSSQVKKKNSAIVKKTQKTKSKAKKKKKRKKRRRYVRPIKMKYPESLEIIKDTILCEGVSYKKILYGTKYKHHIHLIEADMYYDNILVQVLKGAGSNSGLQKLQEMVSKYTNSTGDTIFSAINANFWKAGTNYPIGPTLVDGELVEMTTYKKWTSALFSSESEMFIDNFYITGDVMFQGMFLGGIEKVNRRTDSNGIVVYNKYVGDAVPYISSINISADIQTAFKQLQTEQEFRDSSDFEVDSMQLVQELISQKQMSNKEFNLYKSVCSYLTEPCINKPIKLLVKSTSQGVADMPAFGCIISYGTGINTQYLPKPGDTIIVKYTTNLNQDTKFYQGVSGTPRLVRNGKANHEAYFEGSKGYRFINMQLPRSAIGTDKNRQRIFFVAVEGTVTSDYKAGANLEQLAQIMLKIGSWNAMNLDGGGSTVMVVDGKNVLFPSKPEIGRRVSVGLGILKVSDEKSTK